ncbi:uncharacterized protein Gasu_65010 [Galdieria sulphuraria]|uniref:Uncharacterized protein n=1 Tax=Galdieria sulphuraria TaxID=130081 RepID=M2WQ06_GALSU|nr:uncharacterized protein Gasu_65010 [Galdieria sulphuraria]EME25840.1 hypothetical protein Gasu_65010 [Galdieria sulphuraria]|eukprot:XP_005702360.1 hypothetical protein Gasu_65010 [Galdieria sulphuraria]
MTHLFNELMDERVEKSRRQLQRNKSFLEFAELLKVLFSSLLSYLCSQFVVFTKFKEKAVKTFKPKQSCLPSKTPQLYSRLLGRDNSTMI